MKRAHAAADRSRWRRWLPYALIAFVAFAAYANTLRNGLAYDDKIILQSPLLHDPWNVGAIFDNKFYGEVARNVALYRPLNDWSYLANHRLDEILTGSGASPAGLHVVNIALHAAAGCLLLAWLVTLQLDRRVAFTAALLFAVLPIHTETVANITGRSDAQATMFGLAFLILHRRGAWFLAAPAYLCALWSKESAIAFLPLAIATDLIFRDREQRWKFTSYALCAALAATWFFLRADAMRNVGGPPSPPDFIFIENRVTNAPLRERIFTACSVQLDYLRLQLYPKQLSSDYSLDQLPVVTSVFDKGCLGFLAVLAAAVASAWFLRKRAPVVTMALLGYAILFSTTSNFIVPIGTIMAERLAYMPSLFFCLLLAIGLWNVERWIGARGVIAAIALFTAAYAAKTIAQNRVWRDDLTLFAEQIRSAPRSAKSHVNYGGALDAAARQQDEIATRAAKDGRQPDKDAAQAAAAKLHREAIAQLEQSLSIYDKYGETYYLIGNALHGLHEDPEKIIAAFRDAIRVTPGHIDARINLALTLIDARRFDEARVQAQEVAARAPNHPSLPGLARLLSNPGALPSKK